MPLGPSADCLSLPRLLLFFSHPVAVNSWVRPLPLPVSLSLVLSSLCLSLSLVSFGRLWMERLEHEVSIDMTEQQLAMEQQQQQ